MELPEFLYIDADGEITFKGHRLRLIDVARKFDEGFHPETIVYDWYPTLTLAQVYKAIGFYLDHQDEVKKMMEENDREIEHQAAQPQSTPSLAELRRRLEAKRRAEAS